VAVYEIFTATQNQGIIILNGHNKKIHCGIVVCAVHTQSLFSGIELLNIVENADFSKL